MMHPKKAFALMYCAVMAVVLFIGGRGACSCISDHMDQTWRPTAGDKYEMRLDVQRKYQEKAEKEGKPYDYYNKEMYRELVKIGEM